MNKKRIKHYGVISSLFEEMNKLKKEELNQWVLLRIRWRYNNVHETMMFGFCASLQAEIMHNNGQFPAE